MCGLAGFIDFKKTSDEHTLKAMTDSLLHRGPDDAGYEVFDEQKAVVGFGHRRLSIIDLSPLGHQPMHFGHLSIVFNGEIYNYQEIRKELEEKHQYVFKTHSDTEVILQSFDKWGIECVHKFNGMFAFSLLDRRNQKLYFVRDRAGVKPFYIYAKGSLVLFASELKAFHQHPAFRKELNRSALRLFLQYGYIPAPHTIFEDTEKLIPGTYMVLDLLDGTTQKQTYWDVYDHYRKPTLVITDEDALSEMDSLLHSAFQYRMVSDVPVGVFLSGGYDSSAVAAILQHQSSRKIKTFTIGFQEDAYNEAQYARKVSEVLGTDHTEHYCTEKEAKDIIPQLPFFYDEPFGDSSSIPTILVSKVAREQVTVALSADAGDETFAGYNRHTSILNNINRLQKHKWLLNKTTGKLMSNVNPERLFSLLGKTNGTHYFNVLKDIMLDENGVNGPVLNKYTSRRISTDMLDSLLVKPSMTPVTAFDSGNQLEALENDLTKVLAIDYKTYMSDDILVKVDRATMAVSLEGREPLIDHRIVEFAAQLPSHLKLRGSVKKYMLKEIAHRYLPKEIMERPKMGFGVPVAKWLKSDLNYLIEECLNEKFLAQQGIFNPKEVQRYVHKFKADKSNSISWELIWFLLIFQMWYVKWMK